MSTVATAATTAAAATWAWRFDHQEGPRRRQPDVQRRDPRRSHQVHVGAWASQGPTVRAPGSVHLRVGVAGSATAKCAFQGRALSSGVPGSGRFRASQDRGSKSGRPRVRSKKWASQGPRSKMGVPGSGRNASSRDPAGKTCYARSDFRKIVLFAIKSCSSEIGAAKMGVGGSALERIGAGMPCASQPISMAQIPLGTKPL